MRNTPSRYGALVFQAQRFSRREGLLTGLRLTVESVRRPAPDGQKKTISCSVPQPPFNNAIHAEQDCGNLKTGHPGAIAGAPFSPRPP